MNLSKSRLLLAAFVVVSPLSASAANLSEAEIRQAWECAAASAGAIQIYEDEGNAANAEGAKYTFFWWKDNKLGTLYNQDTLIEWVKKIQHAPFEETKAKTVGCNRIARGLTAAQIAAEEEQDRIQAAQIQAESERRQREQAEYQARQQSELASKCQSLADSSTQLAMNVYENAMRDIENPGALGWSRSILSPGCSGIRNAMDRAYSMGCPSEIRNELQRFYNQYYIGLPSGGRVDCR